MFELITGSPGTGKTLLAVSELKSVVDRPVYYFGIPGLKLPWIPLENPSEWHLSVPDGSVVIIDEAQEHFPVRDHKRAVPPGLQALERHRHRGIDIYFITQHPMLIDHHARRLVNRHRHLLRPKGMQRAVCFDSDQIISDPTERKNLARLERKTVKHDKGSFDLYKSAEIHTHKRRIPKPVYYMVGGLFAFFGILAWLFTGDNIIGNLVFPVSEVSEEVEAVAPGAEVFQAESTGVGGLNGLPDMNDNVFDGMRETFNQRSGSLFRLEQIKPVVQEEPWSAPLALESLRYKELPVISGCASYRTPKKIYCKCKTQFGEEVPLSVSQCLVMAKGRIPRTPFYLGGEKGA